MIKNDKNLTAFKIFIVSLNSSSNVNFRIKSEWKADIQEKNWFYQKAIVQFIIFNHQTRMPVNMHSPPVR